MNNSIAFNKEHEVVIRESDEYHLAFTDVEILPDGRLLVAYRQGESHVDPSGKIIMQYGSPDGLSWDEPRVVFDDPHFDSRDPSLSLLSNNDIALTFFKYHKYTVQEVGNLALVHNYISLSNDSGKSFSEPIQIDPGKMKYSAEGLTKEDKFWCYNGENIQIKGASSQVIERSDGSLLLPQYCQSPGVFGPITFAECKSDEMMWRIREIIPGEIDDLQPNEPAIVVIDEDLWLLHVRTQKSGGFTYQSVSYDGGLTWSKYRNLGFVGHSPELLKLKNGMILAAYRVIDDNVKVAFIYSLDNGKTWSDFTVVEEWDNADCGYPGLVELPGNRFLITYYAVTEELASIKAAVYSFSSKSFGLLE